MKTEICSPFSKLYRVEVANMSIMKQKFDEAWRVICKYREVKITTCTNGWACIEANYLSEAEVSAMEAELDKVFS